MIKVNTSKDNKLIANINDSAGHAIAIDLSELQSTGELYSKSIVSSLVKFCSSYNSLGNAKKLRSTLQMLGKYYFKRPCDFKNITSLYSFLFDFRAYWYTTDEISQRLDIRNSSWDVFRKFIKFLMSKKVIVTTAIPPGNPKLHNKDILARLELTEGKNEDNECITTLVPISLARTDDEYLIELEIQLKSARDTFLNCAKCEIDIMRTNMKEGNQIIESVDYKELEETINKTLKTKTPYKVTINTNNKEYYKQSKIKISLFGPRHPNGYQNTLARIHYKHNGIYPGYNNNFTCIKDPALIGIRTVIPSSKKLGEHLGLLTIRNAVPFFVYILLKNPKFNVEALINVEVEGKNGINQYLSSAGEGPNNIRMKVKKGRAKCEKSAIFDEDTKEVLQTLLRMTSAFRKYLKDKGDPQYNKLWICGGKTGNEIPYAISIENIRIHFGQKAYRNDLDQLSNNKKGMAKRSFLMSHKDLKKYIGIAKLSRMRTTSGLIKWLESGGDMKAVARLLGNTISIAINHYIPKPLQLLMNKRIIRRFQNLLLIVATAGERLMLKCTDFTTIDEVHLFISQMLECERGNENEILAELKKRLNKNKDVMTLNDIKCNINKVIIKVTAENLAILRLYQEHVDKFDYIYKTNIDNTTKTEPYFWSEMSKQLKEIITTDNSKREFIEIYNNSIIIADELRDSVIFPQIVIN